MSRKANTHVGDALSLPSTACESLLRWPIFAGILTTEQTSIGSFIFDAPDLLSMQTDDEHVEVHSYGTSDASPSENGFVALCKKFLKYVHPRNPILEPEFLMKRARKLSECGLDWSSSSCLVVSCDLATLALDQR